MTVLCNGGVSWLPPSPLRNRNRDRDRQHDHGMNKTERGDDTKLDHDMEKKWNQNRDRNCNRDRTWSGTWTGTLTQTSIAASSSPGGWSGIMTIYLNASPKSFSRNNDRKNAHLLNGNFPENAHLLNGHFRENAR